MSEYLDLNLQTQFCTLKDEGISILAFVRNFFKKMSEDQRYKAILKDYLSHDPFKIYKCYQNNPNSGDIFLNECKITCAISSPFSTITEFFSSFDCDLLNTVIWIYISINLYALLIVLYISNMSFSFYSHSFYIIVNESVQ